MKTPDEAPTPLTDNEVKDLEVLKMACDEMRNHIQTIASHYNLERWQNYCIDMASVSLGEVESWMRNLITEYERRTPDTDKQGE